MKLKHAPPALTQAAVSDAITRLLKEAKGAQHHVDTLYPTLLLLVFLPAAASCFAAVDAGSVRLCAALWLALVLVNVAYMLWYCRAIWSITALEKDEYSTADVAIWASCRQAIIRLTQAIIALVLVDLGLAISELTLLTVWTTDRSVPNVITLCSAWLVLLGSTTFAALTQRERVLQYAKSVLELGRRVCCQCQWSEARTGWKYAKSARYALMLQDVEVPEPALSGCQVWVPRDLPDPVISAGNCRIRDVRVSLPDLSRHQPVSHGKLEYSAQTVHSWTGDVVHAWIDGLLPSRWLLESVDNKDGEEGLWPDDFEIAAMYPSHRNKTWYPIVSTFQLQPAPQREENFHLLQLYIHFRG